MPDDPWSEMSPGMAGGDITVRRADPSHAFGVFWGRDHLGRPMLLIRHAPEVRPPATLPVLAAIEVSAAPTGSGDDALVVLLKEADVRDLFHHLCLDLIEVTRSARDERSALAAAVARVWNWQEMLARRNGPLDSSREQGLLGELLILGRLLDLMDARDALASWKGPLDAPQDFLTGPLLIEVKTRQPGRPWVTITSEDQLSVPDGATLLLHVHDLAPAATGAAEGMSLSEVASALMGRVADTDPGSVFQLRSLLTLAGWPDLSSDTGRRWEAVGERTFLVDAGFPAIRRSAVPAALSRVRYRLDVDACEPFRVSVGDYLSASGGR